MALSEPSAAPGKATALVAMLERTPQRGRNRACARADVGDATVSIVAHHHAARIARQPLGRLRRNLSAALDDRLPERVGVCQHRRVDVDHDLIPFVWTS